MHKISEIGYFLMVEWEKQKTVKYFMLEDDGYFKECSAI